MKTVHSSAIAILASALIALTAANSQSLEFKLFSRSEERRVGKEC